MKYPLTQFETLLVILKQFAVHFDLTTINVNSLHYMAYQQLAKSQKHNWLFCVEGGSLKRDFQLTDTERLTAIKLIDLESEDFKLYPDGCNDTHIETAMKKALQLLK